MGGGRARRCGRRDGLGGAEGAAARGAGSARPEGPWVRPRGRGGAEGLRTPASCLLPERRRARPALCPGAEHPLPCAVRGRRTPPCRRRRRGRPSTPRGLGGRGSPVPARAPRGALPAMAFTFAAFCYMLSLVLCAALIFFAIWHCSHPERRGSVVRVENFAAADFPWHKGARAPSINPANAGALRGTWLLLPRNRALSRRSLHVSRGEADLSFNKYYADNFLKSRV